MYIETNSQLETSLARVLMTELVDVTIETEREGDDYVSIELVETMEAISAAELGTTIKFGRVTEDATVKVDRAPAEPEERTTPFVRQSAPYELIEIRPEPRGFPRATTPPPTRRRATTRVPIRRAPTAPITTAADEPTARAPRTLIAGNNLVAQTMPFTTISRAELDDELASTTITGSSRASRVVVGIALLGGAFAIGTGLGLLLMR